MIGISVGHLYYYLEDIVPKIPEVNGFKLLRAPAFLVAICEKLQIHGFQIGEEDFIFEEEVVAPGNIDNGNGADMPNGDILANDQ